MISQQNKDRWKTSASISVMLACLFGNFNSDIASFRIFCAPNIIKLLWRLLSLLGILSSGCSIIYAIYVACASTDVADIKANNKEIIKSNAEAGLLTFNKALLNVEKGFTDNLNTLDGFAANNEFVDFNRAIKSFKGVTANEPPQQQKR